MLYIFQLIFRKALVGKYFPYAQFIGQETEAAKLSVLAKVPLASGGAQIGAQEV